MRQDILKLISGVDDVTNIIILTYNIDFVFLEKIVLPILNNCGHPTITIFADADCIYDSFQRQGQLISGIGRRYRVVPVVMDRGYRFHPKATLLSSEEKAILFVGSGNLGFGGWRENGEIWVCFDTDDDGSAPFELFHQYLKQVIDRVPLNDTVTAEIEEAFEPDTRSWIRESSETKFLVGKVGTGKSLIEQILKTVNQYDIERLTICTPYFDAKGEMIKKLAEQSAAKQVGLLVQERTSGLSKDIVEFIPSDIDVQSVDFRKDDEQHHFLHAKFYAFERADKVTVFLGSANCSRAALAVPGIGGNAELMAVQTINRAEFKEYYLDELEFLPGEPQLPELKEEIIEKDSTPKIWILAARFETGELRIEYLCSEDVAITACLVDGQSVDYEPVGERQISVHVKQRPNRVLLEGIVQGETIRSAESWIDNELELRSSSRERALAEAIHDRVRTDKWDIHAWVDILSLFRQHLQYMPQRRNSFIRTSDQARTDKDRVIYSEEDVFSSDYGLPLGNLLSVPHSQDEYLHGLRQILLRWFGVGWQTNEEVEPTSSEEELEQEGESDESVEQTENVHLKEQNKIKEQNEAKRQSAERMIDKVLKTMLRPNFLKKRPLHQLGMDLALASTLFRYGLKKKWLDFEHFLELTHELWSTLFFSADIDTKSGEKYIGWLEYRYQSAEDQKQFVNQLTSIDLSAALASWALAVPSPITNPKQALFALACAESIAKFPWLWNIDHPEEVANKLKEILIYTGTLKVNDDNAEKWLRISKLWKELVQRGVALRKLQRHLDELSLNKVRTLVSREKVKAGELLWQGTIGLCVLGKDCKRTTKTPVPVLCLQSPEQDKPFAPDYLVPFDALLSKDIIQDSSFGEKERRVLEDFTSQLSEGLKDMDKF